MRKYGIQPGTMFDSKYTLVYLALGYLKNVELSTIDEKSMKKLKNQILMAAITNKNTIVDAIQ